jgi:uncharacterized protein (TIGR00251 family)
MAAFQFHIVPNAKQNKVVGEHGGAIKIKLRAPALQGKANAALCRFLAEALKISERRIVLERGHKSRDKLIRIEGLSEEEVRSGLLRPWTTQRSSLDWDLLRSTNRFALPKPLRRGVAPRGDRSSRHLAAISSNASIHVKDFEPTDDSPCQPLSDSVDVQTRAGKCLLRPFELAMVFLSLFPFALMF